MSPSIRCTAAYQRSTAHEYSGYTLTIPRSPILLDLRRSIQKKRRKWSANSIGGGTFLRGRNLKSVRDNGSILIQSAQEFAGEIGNILGGSFLRIPIAISVKHVSDSRYPSH